MKTLIKNKLEKYNPNKRDTHDMRKKITWAVFSYTEEGTGHEYRKTFTAKPWTPEVIMWNLAPDKITQ